MFYVDLNCGSGRVNLEGLWRLRVTRWGRRGRRRRVRGICGARGSGNRVYEVPGV